MINAGPYANIPDRPDPVAPQKFTDVDTTSEGNLFLYDELSGDTEEWITADCWVEARDNR